MRIQTIVVGVIFSAVFFVKADVATLFTDTEMLGWSKAYTSGAITNMTITSKAGAGNPAPAVEFKVFRDSTATGIAKLKRDSSTFELNLPDFHSTYNVQSIDSFDISYDVQYGIGAGFIGFRKWDLTSGLMVAEALTSFSVSNGNSTWATKTMHVAADPSGFQGTGAGQMTFGDEGYRYTFALFFQSNAGAVIDSAGFYDNLKVDVNYTTNVYGYATWAAGWGVDIGPTTNDYDKDQLSNIYEYGLGGDPTNSADQGSLTIFGVESSGGTNYFSYIHPQLSDTNSGLNYFLEQNTDLILGTWSNTGFTITGTNVTGDTLDYVTNFTDTVDATKFIHLIIE